MNKGPIIHKGIDYMGKAGREDVRVGISARQGAGISARMGDGPPFLAYPGQRMEGEP